MPRLVLRGARWPGDVALEDGWITAVGYVPEQDDDQVLDVTGDIVTAGLVNTHHHLYQWLTRGRAVNSTLFEWLTELYPVWGHVETEDVHAAAVVGLAELARSGCTTAFDHHFLVPHGDEAVFDALVGAARQVGVRIHYTRGSIDIGVSGGALAPDNLVEGLDDILSSTEELYARLDDRKSAVLAIGPVTPFAVSPRLMTESAALARRLGVRLHTHLAETADEIDRSMDLYGTRPLNMIEEWGWLADDVWFAHGIHFTDDEIARVGAAGAGVAHCPSSNGRLGAGMCRVRDLLDVGVPVGLGVDGVASNEVGHLFPELRQATYTARLREPRPSALTPPEALGLATEGGARCLGRDDIGRLEPGARADIAVWPAEDLADVEDALAGLVLGPDRLVRHLLVGGKTVVSHGELVNVDLRSARQELVRRSRRLQS